MTYVHDAIIVAAALVLRDMVNERTADVTKDADITASGLGASGAPSPLIDFFMIHQTMQVPGRQCKICVQGVAGAQRW